VETRPAVSVIIATYNSSSTLQCAISSVLEQDRGDWEVWAVGDGCTDDSADVVAAFDDRRISWVNLPANSGGPSAPRNEGLRRARGPYVAYLGHDDLWFPWHLSTLLAFSEAGAGDLVSSIGANIGPPGVTSTFTLPERPWLWRTPLSPTTWVHRRDLAERIGPWSAAIKLGADCDYLQRAMDAGARVAVCSELTALKFAAERWRAYGGSASHPQPEYLEALRCDATALQLRLLNQAATLLAREEVGFRRRHRGLARPWRLLIRLTCDLYGRQRWPLNDLLYWRWRRRAGLRRQKDAKP